MNLGKVTYELYDIGEYIVLSDGRPLFTIRCMEEQVIEIVKRLSQGDL